MVDINIILQKKMSSGTSYYGEREPMLSSPDYGGEDNEPEETVRIFDSQSGGGSGSDSFWNTLYRAVLTCIPLDKIFLVDESTVKIRNSRTASVFLLLNTMIGAGVLVQPSVFNSTGVILATLIFILVGYFTYIGVKLLIKIAEQSGHMDYAKIALYGLGPYGAIAVDLSIVIFNGGTILSYALYIGELSRSVLVAYGADPAAWYSSESFLLAIISIIVVFPLCLIRRFGHLAVIAYFSVAMLSTVVLLVCVDGPILYAKNSGDGDINYFSLEGAVESMGQIVYALGFTPAVLFTYNALDNKYKPQFSNIAKIATAVGTFMCFIVGLVGYLIFRDDTNANILDNFSGPLATLCKIGMAAHFALFVPGDFIILRASFYHLVQCGGTNRYKWKSNETDENENPIRDSISTDARSEKSLHDVTEQSNIEFISSTCFLLFSITLTACLIDYYYGSDNNGINFVINITGGIAGSLDTFILPGLCGMAYLQNNRKYYVRSLAILVFGIATSLIVTAGSFDLLWV